MSQFVRDRVAATPSRPGHSRSRGAADYDGSADYDGDDRYGVDGYRLDGYRLDGYGLDGYGADRDIDVRYARSGYAALTGGAVPPAPRPPWSESLRQFARLHGWRAYALPVLVVVTIAALASTGGGRRSPPGVAGPVPTVGPSAASPTPTPTPSGAVASASRQIKVDASNGDAEALASDALPPGAGFTQTGNGTFAVIAGTSPVVGTGTLKRYVIEYEGGITGVDLSAFAAAVQHTLSDPRSWTGGTRTVALQRVTSPADADFRISLTSSITVRALCGYEQKTETSCFQAVQGVDRVTLNVARWVRGDTSFGQDVAAYHLYMINHEVGHALGHVHTYRCLPHGLAPVMMQQTITLKENQGVGPTICQPNAWPYPVGVPAAVAVAR